MSNQQNPHAYSLMCRCPLRDAAKVKTKADKNGLALSAYVAKLIKEDAGMKSNGSRITWRPTLRGSRRTVQNVMSVCVLT